MEFFLEFFSKAEDLKNMVDEHEHQKCLVPVSATFPTLDAIVITHEFVITVQMSVASRGDADNIGFEKVHDYLPSKVLATRQWCHVFLTDTGDKANLLRRQTLTEIPEKMEIHAYSAFVNIEELDSILTKERVEELIDDMVRTGSSKDRYKDAGTG
ncbi:hypothetical protein EDB85DRAFT_1889544 [Lactarius pseudohatsudake]|nr:hypothetical protein EDB85DRAFT_1889544 [Lactarius pseudohatsudake]